MAIEHSAVYDNRSAGLEVDDGAVEVLNNTFSGNGRTGISCRFNASSLNLTNNTITDNGGLFGNGLVCEDSQIVLTGNLISGNRREVTATGSTYLSIDNLFGHSEYTNSQAFSSFIPDASDITATSDGTLPTSLDSILVPVSADNGGETLTHALVPGSPAIDVIASGPDTDQRGSIRPAGLAYDIGSFEHEPVGYCNGLIITVDLISGQTTTPGDDVVLGTEG